MSKIKLPAGENIWFKKTGSGPTVFHIHGSAFGHKNFEKLTPYMSDNLEIIDFDLPGYGESTGSMRDGGMEGLADQVNDFITALGYTKVHVHGTSFGAMIALNLAYKYPKTIDKLILSCFMTKYDNAARMMRSTWKRAASESGMDAVADLTSVAGFARNFYDLDTSQAQLESMREAFIKTSPEAFIAGTETIEKSDLTPLINFIRSPTLLLAGDEDNMTPFNPSNSGVGMSQFSKGLTNCKVEILKQCGHYLVIEQPKEASILIRKFIENH